MANQFRKQVDLGPKHQAALNTVRVEQGTDWGKIVGGIIDFGGAAASMTKAHLDKQIAEDELRQKTRVAMQQLPDDDATVAGHRAATIMATQQQMEAQGVTLAEFAKTNPSQEEWESAVIKANNDVKDYLRTNFGKSYDSAEVQKTIDTDMIKMMEPMAKIRKAAELRHQDQQSQQVFSNSVLGWAISDDPNFDQNVKGLAQTLNLSPEKAKENMVNAILESGNTVALQRLSSLKMEGSDNTLGEVDSRVSRALTAAKARDARNNAAQMAESRLAMDDSLMSGKITPEQWFAQNNEYNSRTGGAFDTADGIAQRYKAISREQGQKNYIQGLSTKVAAGGSVSLVGQKKETKQAIATNVYNGFYQDALEQIDPSMRDTIEGQTQAQGQAIYDTVTQLSKQGIVSEDLKNKVQAAFKLNPDEIITKGQDGEEIISPEYQAQLNLWGQIPEQNRADYASGREAQMANAYLSFTRNGENPARALRAAQIKVANGFTPKEYKEAADEVIDELGGAWYNFFTNDANDGYQEFMRNRIAKQLYDQGALGSTQATIANLKKNTFDIGGGQYINASPEYLTDSLGFGKGAQASVAPALEYYKEVNKQAIERAATIYGFEADDVVIDINQETGRVSLMAPNGFPIMSATKPLNEIGQAYREFDNERRMKNYETGNSSSRSISSLWMPTPADLGRGR